MSRPLSGSAMRDARGVAMAIASAMLVGTGACHGAEAAPSPAPPTDWHYRVVAGDTLYSIANSYLAPGSGWQRLQNLNRVVDPKRLEPGRDLRMPVAWLRAEATVASVAFLSGSAQRERAGERIALAVGDTLQPGDLLRTGPDANLTLRLADSTRVLVSGGSQLRMDSLLVFGHSGVTRSQLSLDEGEAESRVNPQHTRGSAYDIRTPVLTLGVRGTEFRVRVGAGSTAAEVTEGRVAARSGRKPVATIADGFGMVAGAAGATPVKPLPPAPGLSTLPGWYEHLPLRFSWPALADAAGYRAQVFVDETLNQRVLDGTFDEPVAQWTDLPDGRYLLQVRARDAQGLEGRSSQRAFTLKARPEPPFTTAPRDDGHAYGERVEFGWTKAAAAERYHLQVADDARFESVRIDRSDVGGEQLVLALPPGRYHWRIASIAAGDDPGPFSDASRFELRETPPPVALEPPKAEGDRLVFRWRERSSDEAYDVQVATDAAFTQIVLERRENLPELAMPRPAPGRYFLRVRTQQADGFTGPWGATQQFDVPRSLWWWLLPGAAVLLLL
jgi:hypothetical protein